MYLMWVAASEITILTCTRNVMRFLMAGYLSFLNLVCTVVGGFIWDKKPNPGMSKSKYLAAAVQSFIKFGRLSSAIMKGI